MYQYCLGKLDLLTHKALKCLPNTFSECDDKVQIEKSKGIKEGHSKIFENFLSKIKQDIFKIQISRHDLKYTFFFR